VGGQLATWRPKVDDSDASGANLGMTVGTLAVFDIFWIDFYIKIFQVKISYSFSLCNSLM
jgi:hypothetical protein